MAISTCPKCNNTTFEVAINEPAGGQYKLLFVQCSICGAVISARDYFNTSALLLQQNKALKRIAAALNVAVDLEV